MCDPELTRFFIILRAYCSVQNTLSTLGHRFGDIPLVGMVVHYGWSKKNGSQWSFFTPSYIPQNLFHHSIYTNISIKIDNLKYF